MIIQPISAPLREDFLTFFDGAFHDNPQWGGCYCMAYLHPRHDEWTTMSAAQNREAVGRLIDAGSAPGLLAYEDDKVVGWCRALPLLEVPAFAGTHFVGPDAADVGSILCFVVDPAHRGQGIATRLLGAACEMFRSAELKYAEAYPRKDQSSAAESYEGPIAMYEHHGFEVVEERPHRLRMRLSL